MAERLVPLPADDEPFDLEREPLEQPPPFERDWGGSDPSHRRPVRAHVLAALRPSTGPYQPPVDDLRALGDLRKPGVEDLRRTLAFRQEHLPELLRMARDRELYTADGDTDEVWAPLHAFATLAELNISEALPDLIPLFDLNDDWLDTALPELLGKVGAPALEPIADYLADRTRWFYGQALACRALQEIAKQHPELREQVVEMLSQVLRDDQRYGEIASTGAMGALIELKAAETLPLIRQAFEQGRINEMMYGPWGDVLKQFAVEPEQDDPLLAESQRRFDDRHERLFSRAQREELQQALARWAGRDPQHMFNDQPPTAPLYLLDEPPLVEVQPAMHDWRRIAQEKAKRPKISAKAQPPHAKLIAVSASSSEGAYAKDQLQWPRVRQPRSDAARCPEALRDGSRPAGRQRRQWYARYFRRRGCRQQRVCGAYHAVLGRWEALQQP